MKKAFFFRILSTQGFKQNPKVLRFFVPKIHGTSTPQNIIKANPNESQHDYLHHTSSASPNPSSPENHFDFSDDQLGEEIKEPKTKLTMDDLLNDNIL